MGSAELFLILGLVMIAFTVYNIVSIMLENSSSNELVWDEDDAPKKSKSGFIEISRPLAHFFALGLAAKVKAPDYRKNVKHKIDTAGLSREINVDEFIAIQIFWGVFYPIVMSIMNFTFELGFSPVFIFGLAGVGVYFPHLHAQTSKQLRYQSVILDLPFFIDLLALATEAGLDFIGAIQKVVDKAKEESVLAEELGIVLRDIKLGRSREEALRDLAKRLDMNEITSFVSVVIDSDQSGIGIGTVLKQQSEQMRLTRFSRAEKAGAKASQMMLIPMMMFIMPAVFIMVFGPVILQFMGQGN